MKTFWRKKKKRKKKKKSLTSGDTHKESQNPSVTKTCKVGSYHNAKLFGDILC